MTKREKVLFWSIILLFFVCNLFYATSEFVPNFIGKNLLTAAAFCFGVIGIAGLIALMETRPWLALLGLIIGTAVGRAVIMAPSQFWQHIIEQFRF